jgi:hypothetical protein
MTEEPQGNAAVAGQLERGVRPLTPLQARIVAALEKMPGRRADWYDLGRMLWPMDKHPRAWNYSSNGGPPGWTMSLSRAVGQLQRAGLAHDVWKAAGVRSVRLLRPNVRAKLPAEVCLALPRKDDVNHGLERQSKACRSGSA